MYPKVSFIIPTFNADKYLERCLKSICEQDYPKDKFEIIVADMGSTDRTIELANHYGCTIFQDPIVLSEQRVVKAKKKAKGEFIVFLSSDNELACNDWLTKMLKPFENENVYGVFTPIVDSFDEKPFTRYFNLMQRDPFSWYIIGKVNPQNVTKKFPVLKETDDYIVFNYTTERCDLIAYYHQGFVARSKFEPDVEKTSDDMSPIIEMIKKGYKIAYVKNAGIHHHTLESFKHFIKKFNDRMIARFTISTFGWRSRQKYMAGETKVRQYMWFLYSLTLIGSSIDMVKGLWKDRSVYWLYHPLACFSLSCSALMNYCLVILNRFSSRLGIDFIASNPRNSVGNNEVKIYKSDLFG